MGVAFCMTRAVQATEVECNIVVPSNSALTITILYHSVILQDLTGWAGN